MAVALAQIQTVDLPLIGVVLAGGRSKRLGQDKALLNFRGQPLIAHMLDLLVQAGVDQCIVSGQYADYRSIPDLIEHAGPVGALHALAKAFPDQRFLIVPVDMPLLPVEWLQHLLGQQISVSCMHFEKSPLPLRVDLNQKARLLLDDLLSSVSKDRTDDLLGNALHAPSVWRFTEMMHATVLSWPEPNNSLAMSNINTMQDWEKLSV